MALVERLEMVYIGQQESVRVPRVPVRPKKCGVQTIKKQPAIRQSGQRIMKQVVFELLLSTLALADVAVHDDQLGDVSFETTNRT